MKSWLIALCLFTCSNLHAATLVGHVVGVTDGDTITVLDATQTQYKIRLSGIDAVEKSQDFGQVSKKSLSNLIYNKVVTIEYQKQDRYGRILGKVKINNVDVNLEQISLGMAWFYRKYQNELSQQDRLDYLHAEENAIKNRIGLWVDENPIPPWTYRKK